jgi:asparagine synthase (glutamine-hydrolysing)
MFAVAVWDTLEQSLLLVRDRLGIKPLYYQTSGSQLLFSSEARVLPGALGLDEYALACYLNLGWVPGPRTAFRGVLELPPGHLLRWKNGQIRVQRWWKPRPSTKSSDPGELGEVLTDAVRRHLVADVPVGIFLSSGVDSAVIASLASSLGCDITTYTVSFDDAPDESTDAKRLASRLGLRHAVVPVAPDDVLASIEDFIDDMDQPTVDGLNSWVISRGVRACGAVVALSGVGGDELFAGYSTFRHVPRLTALLSPSRRLPESMRAAPSAALGVLKHTAHSRARRILDAARQPTPGILYAAVRGPLCPSEVEQLRGGWGRDLRRRPPVADADPAAVRDLELEHYLPNQLLRDTDAMSMAHSLEVRVPLLDDEVVAATAALEALGELVDKRLLVAAVSPELESIAASRKRTFTLPVELWLRGPLRDWAGDALHDLAEAGLGFDRRQLVDFFEVFQNGLAGWRPLWSLCVLGSWVSKRRESR